MSDSNVTPQITVHVPCRIIHCCHCGKASTLVVHPPNDLWHPVPLKMASNGWKHRTVNGVTQFACSTACANAHASPTTLLGQPIT